MSEPLIVVDAHTGETMLSARALAALMGVSPAEVRGHARANSGDATTLPGAWQRAARRRAAEYRARTGDESLLGAIEHYASEADR
ncbi:hypothetical protein [Brachybacterium huguangmaarense]